MKGRKLASYKTVGPEVDLAGGEFMSIPDDQCYVDGTIVSGPLWHSIPAMMIAFTKLLGYNVNLVHCAPHTTVL